MTPLSFSLTRKQTTVDIDGSPYVLRELTGAQRDEYLDDMQKRITLGPDGKPQGIGRFAGMQALLISLALVTESGQPVPAKVISGFPASVQSALFAAAQELSGLSAGAKEEVPND